MLETYAQMNHRHAVALQAKKAELDALRVEQLGERAAFTERAQARKSTIRAEADRARAQAREARQVAKQEADRARVQAREARDKERRRAKLHKALDKPAAPWRISADATIADRRSFNIRTYRHSDVEIAANGYDLADLPAVWARAEAYFQAAGLTKEN